MAKRKPKKTPRSLYVIAQEIQHTWPNVYYGAVPYLSAMGQMATMQDMYGVEDAKGIVLYFLANATSWRGPDAKRIKAELNAMIKDARSQNPPGFKKKKSKKKSAKSSAASVVKAIQDWSQSKLDEKPKIYTPAQVKKLGVTPAPSAVAVMLTEDGYFLPRAMADMYDSDTAYDTLDAFSSYLEGLGYTWTGLENDPYGTWYEIIPLTANPRKAAPRKKARKTSAVRWKKWTDPWRAKEHWSVLVGSTSVLVTVDASEPGPPIFRWGVLPTGKKEKTGTEPSLAEAKARALEVASAPIKKKAKKKAAKRTKKNPSRADILRRAMRGT